MIGSIAGDIIGSVYEFHQIKSKQFTLFDPRCMFTDDSVMTVAIAAAILTGRPYLDTVRELGRGYPDAGYGARFGKWLAGEDQRPYGSWGNGSAMRASPVGFAFDTVDDVLKEAARTAVISHDHPEGVKGAQAVALAVFLARTTKDREAVRVEVTQRFGYDVSRTVDSIRPSYRFDESCQGTVPEAIVAFLDSVSYEDAIRNAVSLGGDSDTVACIAGGIAEAFYGPVPAPISKKVRECLTKDLWATTEAFYHRYMHRAAA